MKNVALILLFILLSLPLLAQEPDSTAQPETFVYEWSGEKMTMQKYFIVFLKSGPERSQSEEEAMKLQREHLAYLGGLYEEGIINLNGPTDGTGDIRGFSVYNVATIEQAREYAENDPMVKAGRLVVEVHPWWLAKGSGVK
ncbi:YciI family protein [Gracilimonas sediminicola]|uniref:YciI family protein n=1 Tax=Gracilimonas sediminicola TaxID=2952158 RepID=A0A9X2RDH2_9BACT|nr:YciI family protein [Gracilimonas sediminicola]MCP9291265.1 YciI family protein [Gracilimonas sediminicola]